MKIIFLSFSRRGIHAVDYNSFVIFHLLYEVSRMLCFVLNGQFITLIGHGRETFSRVLDHFQIYLYMSCDISKGLGQDEEGGRR